MTILLSLLAIVLLLVLHRVCVSRRGTPPPLRLPLIAAVAIPILILVLAMTEPRDLGWLTQLMEHDLLSFIAMLSAAIFVIRLTMPINATVVIFAAVLLPAAVHVGANPWIVGFVILLLSENFI